jgi:hypothetical protein
VGGRDEVQADRPAILIDADRNPPSPARAVRQTLDWAHVRERIAAAEADLREPGLL